MSSITLDRSHFTLTVRFTVDNINQYLDPSAEKPPACRITDFFGNGCSFIIIKSNRHLSNTDEDCSLGVHLATATTSSLKIRYSVRAESLAGEEYRSCYATNVFPASKSYSWGWNRYITSTDWKENRLLSTENAVVIIATVSSPPDQELTSAPILDFIHRSVSTTNPSPTEFIAFSQRTPSGRICVPHTFYVDRNVINSNAVLKKYFLKKWNCDLLCNYNEPAAPTSVATDYGDPDSDFDEVEESLDTEAAEERKESSNGPVLGDVGLNGDNNIATGNLSRPTSPDGMQIDASDSSFVDVPSKSELETVAVIAPVYEDKSSKVEPVSPALAPAPSNVTNVVHRSDTHVVVGAASATWKSVLYYLYTGVVRFAPLTSEGKQSRKKVIDRFVSKNPQRPAPCSCKSMYRLAVEMELKDLKERALAHLKSRLSKENIVDEVFGLFASRYEEVQKIEFAVLMQHWGALNESAKLLDTDMLGKIMGGAYPHAGWVLREWLKRVAAPAE